MFLASIKAVLETIGGIFLAVTSVGLFFYLVNLIYSKTR